MSINSIDITEQARAARWLRLAHLGQGRFHMLDDVTYGSVDNEDFGPDLADQQVLDLGCLLYTAPGEQRLEPVIYLGASLGSSADAYTRFTIGPPEDDSRLVVGHVHVNGGHILRR